MGIDYKPRMTFGELETLSPFHSTKDAKPLGWASIKYGFWDRSLKLKIEKDDKVEKRTIPLERKEIGYLNFQENINNYLKQEKLFLTNYCGTHPCRGKLHRESTQDQQGK